MIDFHRGRLRKALRGPATATALLFLFGSISGCKSGDLGPAKHYSEVDLAHGGTIAGAVHFTGKAPAPVMIDMAQDPVCAMSKGDKSHDPISVENGKLANVLVYIQSGLVTARIRSRARGGVIAQKGCRFEPHVSAAMAGQRVEFTNSDSTRHDVPHDSPGAGQQCL